MNAATRLLIREAERAVRERDEALKDVAEWQEEAHLCAVQRDEAIAERDALIEFVQSLLDEEGRNVWDAEWDGNADYRNFLPERVRQRIEAE